MMDVFPASVKQNVEVLVLEVQGTENRVDMVRGKDLGEYMSFLKYWLKLFENMPLR